MYKIILYFLVNGDWKYEASVIKEILPEKDGLFTFEEMTYLVIDIKQNEDNTYDVFVD